MLGNGPQVLGNEPQVLGNDNGPLVLGNGPHLLRIMSQFGIMSHSALCRIRGYVLRPNVIRHYVAFGLMSFGIMSHSALCRIRPYVVRLCVVRRIVVRHNVVRRNVVRHNVGVSSCLDAPFRHQRIALRRLGHHANAKSGQILLPRANKEQRRAIGI